VTIKAQDYAQGEHYARMTDAPFWFNPNLPKGLFRVTLPSIILES
jgi:hypothetical protein